MKLTDTDLPVIASYLNGKYIIFKDKNQDMLVLTTNQTIILTLDVDKNCSIIDKDLTLCFIENMTDGIYNNLEKMPDKNICDIINKLLANDIINGLMVFDKVGLSGLLRGFIVAFDNTKKQEILKGLKALGVYDGNEITVPYMIAKSRAKIDWAHKNLYAFAKFDLRKNHYDICKRTEDGGYIIAAKNGQCGSLKQLISDESKLYIAFDIKATQKISELDEVGIRSKIIEDINKKPYDVANSFVKIEESLEKSYHSLVDKLADQQGFIDNSLFVFPDLEDSDLMKVYSYIKSLKKEDTSEEVRSFYIDQLAKVYHKLYQRLLDSKKSLESIKSKYLIA